MVEGVMTLFPSLHDHPGGAQHNTGLLPYQTIKELARNREISSTKDIEADQFQPASLDLRLGAVAYRVPASFMPGRGRTVMEKIKQFGMHPIDISEGGVLERGSVHIVPLLESLMLSSRISALASPKSTTGRLDIFTRLITDGATAFDRVEPGYEGPLYAEIAPLTFSIVVRKGSRLNQLRLRRGSASTHEARVKKLHEQVPLVDSEPERITMRDDSVGLMLDLQGDRSSRLVGFRAKKHTGIIDVDKRNFYEPMDYWDPIYAKPGQGIILNPDDFYILATKEAVTVPPGYAAEMMPYDTLVGEFRVHYAGFFDPGFGYRGSGAGSKAVLEVRSHKVPYLLEHEQIIGWLRYERLTGVPDKLYGPDLGSSYQDQGLTLGKQFKTVT